jgi:hypothetical protein
MSVLYLKDQVDIPMPLLQHLIAQGLIACLKPYENEVEKVPCRCARVDQGLAETTQGH